MPGALAMFMTHGIPDGSLAPHFHSIPGLCGEGEISHAVKNEKSGGFHWGPAIVSAVPSECEARTLYDPLLRDLHCGWKPDPANHSGSYVSAKIKVIPLK